MDKHAPSSLANYRRKPRILFVGQDNATHSQMAEAYMRDLGAELVDVESAGMESKPIDLLVYQVMDEEDLDIRQQQSKLINADLLTWADLIVTLSEEPGQVRVAIPKSAHHKHWALTTPAVSDDAARTAQAFRDCRDEVKRRVQTMVNAMRLFRSG